MRVLLSGGGTGGHVYPNLAIVRALLADARSDGGATPVPPAPEPHHILYVGSPGGVEEELVQRASLPFAAVESGQLRGRAPWIVAANVWRIRRGVRQAHRLMHDFQPDIVCITGAYVAVPVAIAARHAGIPLLIYLPDLTPGLAIRWLSRLAQKVAVSFEPAAAYFPGKAVVTGYPARAELVAAAADRAGARRRLGLQERDPVLLVMGGSHGARSINRAVCAALPRLLARTQVIHIAGHLDWPWVQREGENLSPMLRNRYHLYAYLHEEMADALAAADLIVNRAGASNLGELPAVGVPAVLVPYPHAGRHQRVNATFLAERGVARVVEDEALDRDLLPTVLALLEDVPTRQRMAQAARALAQPDAAQRMVNLMMDMMRDGR